MSILVRLTLPAKSSRARKRLLDEAELLFDLANMRNDGIRNFRKKWNVLYRSYTDEDLIARRDELQLHWAYNLFSDFSELREETATGTLELAAWLKSCGIETVRLPRPR